VAKDIDEHRRARILVLAGISPCAALSGRAQTAVDRLMACPDDEVEARLLALPGVGPYATAQILMLLGRYSRLILDSWSRPKYARLTGRKASDKTIERRFRRYKRYAGLAFWLYVTRDWVAEPAGIK